MLYGSVVQAWVVIFVVWWACLMHVQTREKRWEAMEAVEAWYEEVELGNENALEALGAAIEALKNNL